MRLGLQYLLSVPEVGKDAIAQKYDEFFREVEWANDHFESLWLTEHHFSDYGVTSSPLLLLAKASAIAPDIRVGTSIVILPLWNPVRLAEDILTLDSISNGRVELGIGRGYQPYEFRGFGVDIGKSRAMFEEGVEVVLDCFKKTDHTFAGDHFSIDAPITVLPRPTQLPHPPIWMASTSPASIEYAAKMGFNFMAGTAGGPSELAVQGDFIKQALTKYPNATRNPEFEVNRFVYCSNDTDNINRAIKESMWQTKVSGSLADGNIPVGGRNQVSTSATSEDEDYFRNRMLLGTPEQIIAQLEALAKAGGSLILCQFRFGGMPHDLAYESMQLFAREVAPAAKSIVSETLQ